MKKVVCLLFDGVEEIEAVTTIDLLRRADIEVLVCSLDGVREIVAGSTSDDSGLLTATYTHDAARAVKGRSGIEILVDSEFDETADALILPGGPGIARLREDGRAAALARRFFDAGKTVAAICAAPLILADAGILEGRKFTAHFSANLPAALNERVVRDGNLITSQGAGTAMDFALALVEHFRDAQTAAAVAKAIMV